MLGENTLELPGALFDDNIGHFGVEEPEKGVKVATKVKLGC